MTAICCEYFLQGTCRLAIVAQAASRLGAQEERISPVAPLVLPPIRGPTLTLYGQVTWYIVIADSCGA
jgi:hypothetical protein